MGNACKMLQKYVDPLKCGDSVMIHQEKVETKIEVSTHSKPRIP